MDRRLLAALFRPGSRLSLEVDLSDADLLARFAATSDDAAFAEVVRRHGPLVWGVCRNLLPNLADAEDAFQATFLALVQSPRAVRQAASLPGWLHGVAVRVAAKLRRGAVRRKQREARAAVAEANSPVPDTAWAETYALVQAEVRRLPSALRTAFLVCEVGGVSQPEAARQLGWKLGTLSGRLTKARQRLMAQLTKQGIGPAAATVLVGVGAAGTPAAVPWRLVEAVGLFPKAAAGVLPALLVQLATEGSIVGVSQLKLLGLAAVAAGGLAVGVGPAVLPVADAQGTGRGGAGGGRVDPPAEAKKAAPAGGAEATADPKKPAEAKKPAESARETQTTRVELAPPAKWEYEYAGRPKDSDEFKKLLADKGKQGWEYLGPVPVFNKAEEVSTLLFKRPVAVTTTREYRFQSGPLMGGFAPMAGFAQSPEGNRFSEVDALRTRHLQADIDRLTQELKRLRQPRSDGPVVPTPPAKAMPPVIPAEPPSPPAPAAKGAAPNDAQLRAEQVERRYEEKLRQLHEQLTGAQFQAAQLKSKIEQTPPPAPAAKGAAPNDAQLRAEQVERRYEEKLRQLHEQLTGAQIEAAQLKTKIEQMQMRSDAKGPPPKVTFDAPRSTAAKPAADAGPVVFEMLIGSGPELVPVVEAGLGQESMKYGGSVRVATLGNSLIIFGATPQTVDRVKQLIEALGLKATVAEPKAAPTPAKKP